MSEPGTRSGSHCRFLNLARALILLAALAAGPALAADCRLAVLGDSLAAGYGVDFDDAFPAQLERALARQGVVCEVLNAGVSGDTSAGGLSRIDWVLGDQPTHLLIELGGNDALRAIPTETLESNLAGIIERAQASGVEVKLAGMLAPPNLGARYTDAFAAVYPRLAERFDIPLYAFFLEGAVGEPELMLPDGIHPNAAGVAAIVERILPGILGWLDGA